MNWVRWYHGTVADPKWRVVAKKAGVSIPTVVAIWAAMLENASASENRGTLTNWNAEDVAACLDVTVETVETVCNAFETKVVFHETLIAFHRRNPKRERTDKSTDRVRKHREKKRHVTPGNAQNREEKSREEGKGEYSTDFEMFWSAYPKKTGKGDAFQVWQKKPHPTVKELLPIVELAKRSPGWLKDGGEFIPNPSTWLNQKRWDDDYSRQARNSSPRLAL